MKLRQPIRHLLRHGKPAERAPALTQDEKARQTEQSIQAGLAANKFPPRWPRPRPRSVAVGSRRLSAWRLVFPDLGPTPRRDEDRNRGLLIGAVRPW